MFWSMAKNTAEAHLLLCVAMGTLILHQGTSLVAAILTICCVRPCYQ